MVTAPPSGCYKYSCRQVFGLHFAFFIVRTWVPIMVEAHETLGHHRFLVIQPSLPQKSIGSSCSKCSIRCGCAFFCEGETAKVSCLYSKPLHPKCCGLWKWQIQRSALYKKHGNKFTKFSRSSMGKCLRLN